LDEIYKRGLTEGSVTMPVRIARDAQKEKEKGCEKMVFVIFSGTPGRGREG